MFLTNLTRRLVGTSPQRDRQGHLDERCIRIAVRAMEQVSKSRKTKAGFQEAITLARKLFEAGKVEPQIREIVFKNALKISPTKVLPRVTA